MSISPNFRAASWRHACAVASIALVSACGGSGTSPSVPAVPVVPVVAPAISAQPANATVAVGSAATFTVAASGTGPLTYQWKRNGADIAGATAVSYSLPTALLADTRSKWTVTVQNSAGVAASAEATLHVTGMGVIAGVTGQAGTVNGPASLARFQGLAGLAIDTAGNLLVTQSVDGALRKVTPSGEVSTLVSGLAGMTGLANVSGSLQLALDSAGNIYATSGMSVVKVTSSGVVTTFATVPSCTGRGSALCVPTGIAIDAANNVYVANNVSIRKIAPNGSVVLLQGTDGESYGSTAFSSPRAMAVDGSASVFVVDSLVRKIDAAGVFTLVAGGSSVGVVDGTGPAAGFSDSTSGAAFDKSGNLYVTDFFKDTIRKVTPAGVVTTIALPAGVSKPTGIAVDAHGDLYVNSDSAIVKIQFAPQ